MKKNLVMILFFSFHTVAPLILIAADPVEPCERLGYGLKRHHPVVELELTSSQFSIQPYVDLTLSNFLNKKGLILQVVDIQQAAAKKRLQYFLTLAESSLSILEFPHTVALFLALKDNPDTVIGAIVYGFRPESQGYAWPIYALAIDFPYQRQSRGAYLLSAALKHAEVFSQTHQIRVEPTLDVHRYNRAAAGLYYRFGFQAAGSEGDYRHLKIIGMPVYPAEIGAAYQEPKGDR